MTSAILQIGFPKCGSSSIQQVLSNNPSIRTYNGNSLEYAAVTQRAGVLSGSRLTSLARERVHGYVCSDNVQPLANLPNARLKQYSQELSLLAGDTGKVVLSYEGWSGQVDLLRKTNLLARLNLVFDVVMYVRPPVEWINSAWWQWGAWTGESFDIWMKWALQRVKWADWVSRWFDVVGVREIVVRPLPSDIISDFSTVVNAPLIAESRSNTSLPGSVLRLFQRHRRLRPGPHQSGIDFSLGGSFLGLMNQLRGFSGRER